MKKRFAVIVLSLCMVLALIPTAAFAADGDTIHVGGVKFMGMADAPAYALTDDRGSVTTEGAGESSYNIRWDGSTLTLNNATITQGYSKGYYIGAVTAISCEADIEIELVGSNTVRGPALTDEGAAETSGIYSEGSITISGTGTLYVRGGDITKTTGDEFVQSYGLYSGEEGNITISSGTVNAFGGDIDTVNGSAYSRGISADGATVITGGKVTAAGGEITNNSGNAASIGIESYGGISIAGGSVEATGGSANVTDVDRNYAYSKGMYAYSGGISITGGSVEATGGSAEIISQDENATLYAESDGIDADNMNDSGGMSITGGSTVTATGGAAAVDGGGGIAYSFGISTDERITVAGSTVTAAGGETTAGDWGAYSTGIEAYNDLVITDSKVEAAGSAAASSSGSAGSQGIYSYWDVMITDSIVTAAGSEANAGAWDAYSHGIYADENINISSGSVNVFGGSAECSSDPETAASLGMKAGTVNISGGDVTAEAGQTGAWTADGIWALLDINIIGGRVTATGASSSADGVMPQYSGGLFSYAGDITVSGEDTVVNAGGGVAGEGITAIAATGGDIVIESGAVRADGASGAPSGFEGLANGLSALKDTYEDDGTGGNIIISGGYLSVAGATDSIYYEGDLVVRPAACGITVRTMDNWITGGDASGPDWDKMDQDAAEIDGSPFTEETVIERGLTEGKLYLGATDGSTYPEDPADPDNPADPTDPDDPADSTGGQNGDGTQTGDAGQTGESTKTGDDSNILMWTALLVAAGAGIFTLAVYMSKRKQRENRRGI